MAHHAYFYTGKRESGIAAALTYAKDTLGLTLENNPDVAVFRYGLFSVDDARKVIHLANQAAMGEEKIIVIAPERIFHEAQNALLKLFEEPPPNTTLVLVIPSTGMLIGTLRSRMLALGEHEEHISPEAKAFIAASAAEREKIIAKLLDRTKSDKDDEKQAARGELLRIMEGLSLATYADWKKKGSAELKDFMHDLERFLPILHERSAPLKPIFEHVLIVMPKLEKVV